MFFPDIAANSQNIIYYILEVRDILGFFSLSFFSFLRFCLCKIITDALGDELEYILSCKCKKIDQPVVNFLKLIIYRGLLFNSVNDE